MTLTILAAGMGSRYGGLKQIDTIGSNGESIIDFTIYDAIKVGFKKLVLIIRKEHEELFEEHLVKKIIWDELSLIQKLLPYHHIHMQNAML